MKKLAMLIVFLGWIVAGFGQLTIKKHQFPFSRIIEWEKHGILVYAEDHKKNTNEQEVILINRQGKEQWRKSIYPKTAKPKLVLSAESDYIYMIDDITPHRNSIRYNQINQSGSVVSTNFDLLSVIRSYGYRTPSELIMKNVINTKKSLVFHFQLEVKSKSIIENFIIMITHHNNRVYHAKGPVTHPERIEEGRAGTLLFAGSDNKSICFGRYSHNANDHRVDFIPYDHKAKKQNPYSFSLPSIKPLMSSLLSVGWDGMRFIYEIEDRETQALGWPLYEHGNYYYASIDENKRCFKVFGANQDGKIVALASCEQPAESSWRYRPTIQLTRLNDASIVCGTIQDQKQCFKLSNEKVEKLDLKPQLDLLFKNPTRLEKSNVLKKMFVIQLEDGYYEINIADLKQQDTITLKRKD